MGKFNYKNHVEQDGCYVYALLCQDESGKGYMKIGLTTNLANRLSSLKTLIPIDIKYYAFLECFNSEEMRLVEKALHKAFSERKRKGEWFDFDFSKEEDKREFNDTCKEVFLREMRLGASSWWDKVSASLLEAHIKKEYQERKERYRKFSISPKNSAELKFLLD